jgi:hypothetical protein
MQVLENIRAAFMQPIFSDWAFYPVAFLFCYSVAFLSFFSAVAVIIFVRITRVLVVNHFLLFFLRPAVYLFL